ncbi:MAG: hypothetical protein BWY06_03241 [Candidatus Latescibacteria bacterium ADurb.Bin168]|nr:MAG: hypothetical protein BWY06_03241 [Candidatus Latescibacteria bacterium ADurb.Bin168]
MGIVSRAAGWIAGKVVSAGAASIVDSAQQAANIVDQFVENPAERGARALLETEGMRDLLLQQAKNKSLLGAGWVGALGWVCTFGIAVNVVVVPMIASYVSWKAGQFKPPEFDMQFIGLMTAVLLGGVPLLRIMEKWFATPIPTDKPKPKDEIPPAKEPAA